MIYDEATINFIIEKVKEKIERIKEIETNIRPLDYKEGELVHAGIHISYVEILDMLQNMKKIKAIN